VVVVVLGVCLSLLRAFDRALGSRPGETTMAAFMPSLVGPSGAGGHPMVSHG
jgi:hypothetical protein